MLQPIEITSTPVDTDQQAGGCCGGACHTDAQATATESGDVADQKVAEASAAIARPVKS